VECHQSCSNHPIESPNAEVKARTTPSSFCVAPEKREAHREIRASSLCAETVLAAGMRAALIDSVHITFSSRQEQVSCFERGIEAGARWGQPPISSSAAGHLYDGTAPCTMR